jgi:hypothetical protein
LPCEHVKWRKRKMSGIANLVVVRGVPEEWRAILGNFPSSLPRSWGSFS